MLIHLKDFAGLIPKISDRSLPPNGAAEAMNTQLYSGEVRGLREPQAVADLSSEIFTVKRAYRLDDGNTSIADAPSLGLPSAPVPEWTNVEFLADFDGVDEATSYTEKSSNARVMTPVSTVKLDDAQVKFGTTSGYFGGSNNDKYSLNDNGSIGDAMVTNDWCVEGWLYHEIAPTSRGGHLLLGSWAALNNERQFNIAVIPTGEIQFEWSTDGTLGTVSQVASTGANVGTTGTWHHIAVTYENAATTLRMFANGIQVYENTSSGGVVHDSSAHFNADILVGGIIAFPQNDYPMNGWIDDARIAVGEAVYTQSFTVPGVHPIGTGGGGGDVARSDWIPFDDEGVNFIRGQIVNDQYDRYYAAGGTQSPVVATAAEWAARSATYDLGVPAPTVAPTVTPAPTSEGSVDETRAYVYTFVNEWGEESAPSPASDPATGEIIGTWQLTAMQTAYPVAGSHKALDKMRIYRTTTGTASVDYRFVTEIDPPLATYDDDGSGADDAYGYSTSTDSISLNESLPSLGWDLPPADLQGIVNMANGIMVGFVGRDIYFSEPYRPHAWPPEYVLSVESPVVGIGVYQSGAVVCTTSNPYVATGMDSASVILARLDDVEPCQAFRSIVNGLDGVLYASQNGLIVVNQSGAVNVLRSMVTRNEWRQEYQPGTCRSATDGSRILTFYSDSEGWLFTPFEPLGHLVDLSGFTDVQGVQTDAFTGEAYYISRDVVYLWNPETTIPLGYTWKSKVFELPFPVNMGAYRLQYEDVITGEDFVAGFDYTAYNTDRFSASTIITETPALTTSPLNTLNLYPINGVRTEANVDDSPPVVQFRMPMGGSPLVGTPDIIRDRVNIKIWGDGVLRYEGTITSNDMVRLPSGYKADKWQIEFNTAQNIYSFKMAGTAKELVSA